MIMMGWVGGGRVLASSKKREIVGVWEGSG
jgi:hypothetical protein